MNWATSGNLLGTKAHFKARFVDPILAGQEPKVKFISEESFISIFRNMHCCPAALSSMHEMYCKLLVTLFLSVIVWNLGPQYTDNDECTNNMSSMLSE